jgi:hypothetical protein
MNLICRPAVPLRSVSLRVGYVGAIDVDVVGNPDITGHVSIPANQTVPANQPNATLYLIARPNLAPGPYSIGLRGLSMINGKKIVHYANLQNVVQKELADLPFPPQNPVTRIGVAITEQPPFTLNAHIDGEAGPGVAVPLAVSVKRVPGFTGAIGLSAVGLPPNVAVNLPAIPAGQNEIRGQLSGAAGVALGEFQMTFAGAALFQGKNHSVAAPPVVLVVGMPFAMRPEPATVNVSPGGRTILRVTPLRKPGYNAPITFALQGLPAGVTAEAVPVANPQEAVEFALRATAQAAVGGSTQAKLTGTSTIGNRPLTANAVVPVIIKK